MVRLAAVVLVLIATPALAAGLPRIRKGTPYATARLTLIKRGYTPVSAEPDPERCDGRNDICAAYPETDSCSGTGLGFCKFVFKGADGTVGVSTTGEEVDQLTVYGIDRE